MFDSKAVFQHQESEVRGYCRVGSGELASKICRLSFEKGLIIETSGPHDEVIKILAPLTTPETLLERGLGILKDAVAEVMVESNPATVIPMLERGEHAPMSVPV